MTLISVEQFKNKYNGASVDFDKKFNAQCVDLFNFYNAEVVGAPFIGTPVTNGARDLYEVDSSTTRDYYQKLTANIELQVGDVMVYADPYGRDTVQGKQIYYGHVRIYVGNNEAIEQNGKVQYKTTVVPADKKYMIGILRPKMFQNQSSPQEVPHQAINKNKHTIQKGDTFWGLEEYYGIEHGKLQQINPTLDARKLPIGGEINLRGEEPQPIAASETYYNIVRNDTFWGLEDAWAIPHGSLQQLNPGVDPHRLQIGQRIRRSQSGIKALDRCHFAMAHGSVGAWRVCVYVDCK